MARGPFYQPGRYWGKVTRQHLGETSTGNPQIILSFEVKGMVNPADPEGDLLGVNANYERSVYRVITENTIDYVKADLDILGWYGVRWSQFDEGSSECVDIRGKEIAFICTHENKQTKDETTGKWVNTAEVREVWSIAQANTGPLVKPLEPAKAKALDAMFGRVLKGRKAPNGDKATSQPAPPAPTPSAPKPIRDMTPDDVNAELGGTPEDEIPF